MCMKNENALWNSVFYFFWKKICLKGLTKKIDKVKGTNITNLGVFLFKPLLKPEKIRTVKASRKKELFLWPAPTSPF